MDKLRELLDKTKGVQPTPQQREAQRQSFAYGNTKFENDDITRETIARASRELADKSRATDG